MKSAFDQRQEIISMAVHGQVLKDGEPKEITKVYITTIDNIRKILNCIRMCNNCDCLFVAC